MAASSESVDWEKGVRQELSHIEQFVASSEAMGMLERERILMRVRLARTFLTNLVQQHAAQTRAATTRAHAEVL